MVPTAKWNVVTGHRFVGVDDNVALTGNPVHVEFVDMIFNTNSLDVALAHLNGTLDLDITVELVKDDILYKLEIVWKFTAVTAVSVGDIQTFIAGGSSFNSVNLVSTCTQGGDSLPIGGTLTYTVVATLPVE